MVGAAGVDAFTGSVYVFVPQPDDRWTEVQKLTASDASKGHTFGGHVTLFGSRMIAGALHSNGGAGAAYVFERNPDGNWTETQTLLPPNASTHGFGIVALSGNRMVAGAPLSKASPSGNKLGWGAAYIYEMHTQHSSTALLTDSAIQVEGQ